MDYVAVATHLRPSNYSAAIKGNLNHRSGSSPIDDSVPTLLSFYAEVEAKLGQ